MSNRARDDGLVVFGNLDLIGQDLNSDTPPLKPSFVSLDISLNSYPLHHEYIIQSGLSYHRKLL